MTTVIARVILLLVLLSWTSFAAPGAPADATPQASHPTAPAQTEAKIGSASHIAPLRPGFQFPYGQTFHYEGEWRFWTAGVATIRIEQSGAQNHVAATVDSTGVVSLLYRVADSYNSYGDAKTLCSNKLIKHSEEGSHRRDTTITYDYGRGKAVLDERSPKDNPAEARGKRYSRLRDRRFVRNALCRQLAIAGWIDLHVSVERWQQDGHRAGARRRQRGHQDSGRNISYHAGGARGRFGHAVRNKGRIWIWYTDDDKHLPIQMRAKAF